MLFTEASPYFFKKKKKKRKKREILTISSSLNILVFRELQHNIMNPTFITPTASLAPPIFRRLSFPKPPAGAMYGPSAHRCSPSAGSSLTALCPARHHITRIPSDGFWTPNADVGWRI